MMITIHGFPAQTKYPEVKLLIQQQCKIEDFMVGNMLPEKGGTKKVRIGLSDDNEGYTVIKCLDGFRMSGNCVLKTIPVVKSTPNQQQQPFERPAFSGNEYPRNDYPPGNDYPAQSSYGNRGPPHGANGPPLSTGPTGPGGPSGRPSQWASNNPAPWNNNTPIAAQNQPNNFNYQQQPNVQSFGQLHPGHTQRPEVRPFQGRPSQDQGYGFPPKSNVPDHGPVRPVETRQLRSIETVDVGGNAAHGRYPPSQPYHQDKPVTIMKENFQGPTQYNINNPDGQTSHYQEPRPQPWQDHGQPGKPQQFSKPTPMGFEKPYEERKYPPTNEREMHKPAQMRPDTYKGYENPSRGYSPGRSAMRGSPMERRVSPSGRRISPPGRRLSPSGRRLSPPGRRLSPSGRRISPPGRRLSPSGGRLSPAGRRVSPPGRRLSPSGRRFSPPGRRVSPPGRMLSPSGRKLSPPVRRFSPSRDAPMGVGRVPEPVESSVLKRASPQHDRRRDSPPRSAMRYSPGRHLPENILDKYGQDATAVKRVRPAYEPPTQASNQAMYSGGYRPSPRETVQYPVGGPRQGDSRSPWQRDRDDYPRKPEEDRRGPPRMEIPRNAEKIIEPTRPPIRKSRSPVRRDRSPIRDRFKRHSPSPRSPRRSWALEKRRSPDISEAPPPPAWPGQGRDDNLAPIDNRHGRNFPGREQPVPTSSRAGFSKAESPIPKWEDNRHPEYEERKPYKPARDVEREIHASHDRYQPRDPKFSPREDFDLEPRNEYRRKDEPPSKYREDERRPRDEDRRHMEDRRARDDSPLRREIAEKLLKVQSIDKDFEDIYNRALQFKKKAEELRRSANRRGESEEAHSGRARDEKRFDDRRDRYRDEEHRRDTEVRPGDDDYYKRDNKERNRGAIVKPKRFNISSVVRAKREKAVEEIAKKIMERHPDFNRLEGEQRQRVVIELQLAIARIVFDMFEDKDVSFIEIVVKYQAKYTVKDEEAILQEVVASLPRQFRNIKRHATESRSEIPSKTARRSSSPGLKQGSRWGPPVRVKSKLTRDESSRSLKPTQRTKPVQKAKLAVKLDRERYEKEKLDLSLPESVETTGGGHYELSPLMTKMVEAELQNIMIKVWQELPDNPTDDAEKLVVDKFRNDAGDDLRNVLGLNISKRLLNVHNPLYVKIQFTGKPEKAYLSAFLKKYNFNAFKRIENNVNTFAAQVKTIADFDRICSAKDIRCGSIKVTVHPCYKFTKCPPNLITNFNGHGNETSDDTKMKELNKSDEKLEKDAPSEESNTKCTTKEESKIKENVKPNLTENKPNTTKKPTPKNEEPKVVENTKATKIKAPEKENKEVIIKKEPLKIEATKAKAPEKENKEAIPKKEQLKVVANTKATNTKVPEKENKEVITKKEPLKIEATKVKAPEKENKETTSKKEELKVVKDTKAVEKDITSKIVADTKKPEATKAKAPEKEVPPKKDTNNTVTKDTAKGIKHPEPTKIQDNSKSNTTQNTQTNKTPKKPVQSNATQKPTPTKQNVEKKVNKVQNDFDELDDHDILALISDGIILDECSGSDEE